MADENPPPPPKPAAPVPPTPAADPGTKAAADPAPTVDPVTRPRSARRRPPPPTTRAPTIPRARCPRPRLPFPRRRCPLRRGRRRAAIERGHRRDRAPSPRRAATAAPTPAPCARRAAARSRSPPAAAAAPAAAKPPAAPAHREARRRGRVAPQLHELGAAGGLGRLFRRLRVEPRGHHALHVPERALRAAAVVQGRLPRRVQRRRGGRALEGRVRRVDRARGRRLLRAHRGLHAPRLLAELAARREQVQVPLPRQRLLPHRASTSRARRRGRWSARASCWPTTARSWSTSR